MSRKIDIKIAAFGYDAQHTPDGCLGGYELTGETISLTLEATDGEVSARKVVTLDATPQVKGILTAAGQLVALVAHSQQVDKLAQDAALEALERDRGAQES